MRLGWRVCVVVTLSLSAAGCAAATHPHHSPAAIDVSSPSTSTAVLPSSSTPVSPAPASSASPTRPPLDQAARTAVRKMIRAENRRLGPRSASVAVLDTASGAQFRAGAPSGMSEASIAKVDIVESLMLRCQREHTGLTESETSLSASMIENSDNDAANDLWEDLGEATDVRHANVLLGLRHTQLGSGIYWGLSHTTASDQLDLLDDLVRHGGPLDHASQTYVLHLMSQVEADQRWGVGAAADTGTSFVNKNGWLSLLSDHDLWVTNSLGIVTVHGDTLLLAVLTQHNPSFSAGVARVQALARATAAAVA